MATLAREYSPPPSPSFGRRCKVWARRGECICCVTLAYFPLFFVSGLMSWATWVEVNTSLLPSETTGSATTRGVFTAFLGVALASLALVSYFTAVFTNPGSPLDPPPSRKSKRGGGIYSSLPMHEDHVEPRDHTELDFVSLTAKTDGRPRYCKKCAVTKPDRTHHCSTCNRCVLKMDHHCPWLATCVGLRNYKAFLLFLIYTSLFCWVCFPVSGSWVLEEIMTSNDDIEDGAMIINVIMLSVLSGIIGLVLSGFAAWHCYLAVRGQTTIESLEKTRYLSPLKKSMERQFKRHHNEHRNYLADEERGDNDHDGRETVGEQLKEIHANMLPGVTRPEEGIDSPYSSSATGTPYNSSSPANGGQNYSSPAQSALRRSYAHMEAERERDRYSAYLDELDSEKLPHAFDLGWSRNLRNLFGEKPYLWPFPICNTVGDGWKWEVSDEWIRRRDEIAAERRRRDDEEVSRMRAAGWGDADTVPPRAGAPANRHFIDAPAGAGRHYQSPATNNNDNLAPWHRQNHPNQTPWSPSWAEADDDDDEDNYKDEDADEDDEDRYITTTAGVAHVPHRGRRSLNKADQFLGRPSGVFNPSTFYSSANASPPRAQDGRNDTGDDSSSSDDAALLGEMRGKASGGASATGDWNDIPEDMFSGRKNGKADRNSNSGRRKGD